ncbi:MAG: hypothetical protein ACLP1X_35100 [Polyangiaceae bacterium]|jgi:hypothetical protein
MSEVNLSSATRAILNAAKKDGPSLAARGKVWGGVSSTVGGAAAAAGGAISAATATTGAMGAAKMLALGTLLGGTLSVGLAATVLYVGQAQGGAEGRLGVRAAAAAAEVGREDVSAVSTSASEPAPVSTATSVPESAPTSTPTIAGRRATGATAPRAAHTPLDVLAREASLVANARSSLASGDPRAALQAIRDTRVLSSRQLEPEELLVEARALRALGRQDEANEADSTLKTQFPESALAR